MSTPLRTVADVIADLSQYPQDMPVLAGCHYDNDDGLTSAVSVGLSLVEHSEIDYYMDLDPNWPSPGSFQAVTIR